MAVLRQFNALGQERLDVPHVRSIESAICADFDVLVGLAMCGARSYIVQGFKIAIPGAIGAAASGLQVVVADSVIFHYNASESGTIFNVPTGRAVERLSPTNAKVSGSFTANTTNYVGVDLRRSADDTTSDTAQFLDADTIQESPKTVPLGRTLDYVFLISTTDFTTTPSVAALAKVVTDTSNNVTSVEDARESLFRLGRGGSVPNNTYAYPWADGRIENSSGEVFTGGDKAITSLKDWMDATMTRLWEIGGGERWYSSVADRNVRLVRSGSAFTNGEYFEWTGTNLHWKGLKFLFPNSTGWYNVVADQTSNSAGLTDLADGECLYVDVDYSANRTGGTALVAVKGVTQTLGSPTSPGTRFIIAWRTGSTLFARDAYFPVGAQSSVATVTSVGVVLLSRHALVPATPEVASTSGGWFQTPSLTDAGTGYTAVTQTGSGLGTVAFSGACGAPVDFMIKITLAGAVATAKYQLSRNRGRDYDVEATTAATVTDTATGAIITFDSSGGNFVLDDTYEAQLVFAPLAVYKNRYGYVGGGRDHLGSEAGRWSGIETAWAEAVLDATNAIWTKIENGGAVNTVAPSSLGNGNFLPDYYPGRSWQAGPCTMGGHYAYLKMRYSQFMLSARAIVIWEWDAYSNTGNDSLSYMGPIGTGASGELTFDGGMASSTRGLYFKRDSAANSGKWIIGATSGSASTNTNTTVSAGGSQWQKFRIEYIGSDYTGGTRTARYFIDGEYVGSITTNLPAATGDSGYSEMGFQAGCQGAMNANSYLYMGAISIRWSRWKDGYLL